jgi:hypothetical protein
MSAANEIELTWPLQEWGRASFYRHQPALRGLREIVAAKLDNVSVVEAFVSQTGLPPNCCDAIVLRRVYHQPILE